jgi:hypothetical protein
MISNRFLLWLAAAGLSLGLLAGCSGRNYEPPATVDSSVARISLEKALSCWHQRGQPETLKSSQPPITVADEDWHAGRRLVAFQLLPGEAQAGATLRWPVRLKVIGPSGREQVVDTTYVIAHSGTMHIARCD